MAIARMVAGGAAGGMDDDAGLMSDERARSLSNEAEDATKGLVASLKGEAPAAKPKVSDKRAASMAARADEAARQAVSNLGGSFAPRTQVRQMEPAPMPARGIAHAAAAQPEPMPVAHGPVYAMAPAYMPAYTPPSYSSYPMPGHEDEFMAQHPSAVMSYPDRTVGYQYAAGAPVTPYMSRAASRPVPQSSLMSMLRRNS